MYSYYVQQLCEHIHVPIDSSSHFSQKILLNTPLYMYYSCFFSTISTFGFVFKVHEIQLKFDRTNSFCVSCDWAGCLK